MALKTVRVEIKGTDDYIRACKSVVEGGKRTVGQFLLEAASMTHRFSVDLIRQGARSGKFYFKTKEKIPHQASEPGEPPKSDTGRLVSNITLEKDGKSGYTVGSRKGAPWGFWLQFGTSKMVGTSKMGARPWLDVAFNKAMAAFMGKYK